MVGVVEVSIGSTSSCPEPSTTMIPSMPPATGMTSPPTATDPPIPIPTTIHPTCALAVLPPLIVNVLVALTGVEVLMEFWVVVGLALVVTGGADSVDVVVLVDVG